jgi:hypothetical protein
MALKPFLDAVCAVHSQQVTVSITTVTAEVASSSLVVPASFFNELEQNPSKLQPQSNPQLTVSPFT